LFEVCVVVLANERKASTLPCIKQLRKYGGGIKSGQTKEINTALDADQGSSVQVADYAVIGNG